MSLDYINKSYKLNLREGTRALYSGEGRAGRGPRFGTVIGANGARVLIRLDGDEGSFPYHPTWRLEYDPQEPAPEARGEEDDAEDAREASLRPRHVPRRNKGASRVAGLPLPQLPSARPILRKPDDLPPRRTNEEYERDKANGINPIGWPFDGTLGGKDEK